MGWIYVLVTISFTTIGQLLVKWKLSQAGPMPSEPGQMLLFLVQQLLSVPIILGFASAFIAALSWMATLTKFELNFIYPFMSLCFPLTMILSGFLLGEGLGWSKMIGTGVIMIGLFILTR
jgi:multidrug transporter EmrE-like cation transporter